MTALLAIGANRVWGPSPTTDYLSGRFALDGSLREANATWSGNVSISRAPSLQNVVGDSGTILTLAYTNAASANGAYTYALTERWSLGATVGAYGNRYDSVNASASGTPSDNLSNNHGYSAGGNAGYAYSDRTQLTFSAVYLHDTSDVARSDSVTTTLGVVHQFSPALTISASLGGYWADIEATQGDAANGNRRRTNGELYGGSVSYAFSERTQFNASLSEGITPSGTGTLSKSDSAGASLTHRFSERFDGRLGASYTRSINPTTTGSSTTNNYAGRGRRFVPARRALETRCRLPIFARPLFAERVRAQVQSRLCEHRLQLARRLVHRLGGHTPRHAGIAGGRPGVAPRAFAELSAAAGHAAGRAA